MKDFQHGVVVGLIYALMTLGHIDLFIGILMFFGSFLLFWSGFGYFIVQRKTQNQTMMREWFGFSVVMIPSYYATWILIILFSPG